MVLALFLYLFKVLNVVTLWGILFLLSTFAESLSYVNTAYLMRAFCPPSPSPVVSFCMDIYVRHWKWLLKMYMGTKFAELDQVI